MAQKAQRRGVSKLTRGAELLRDWRGEMAAVDACKTLGLNEAALYAFLAGRAVPGLRRAARIEEATGGLVPATSWVEGPKKPTRRAA